MRTIVIGLGNPVLSDDGAGIHAARLLARSLPAGCGVEVTEVYVGGIRLMDAMTSYDYAVVIDAMTTGDCPAGTVRRFSLNDIPGSRNLVCSHDSGLAAALEFGRLMGLSLPEEIELIGIEAVEVEAFGEELTPAVAKGAESVAEELASRYCSLRGEP